MESGSLLSLQGAEQIMQVVHNHGVAGKEPAVGIELSGFFVEVACADVGESRQFMPLFVAAQYKGCLGVYL